MQAGFAVFANHYYIAINIVLYYYYYYYYYYQGDHTLSRKKKLSGNHDIVELDA